MKIASWGKSVFILAVGLLLIITPKSAQAVLVDLQLVLAVDVSFSVSSSEFALQRQGYSNAFRNAAIFNAIQNGQNGAIAVSLVYWSEQQVQAIDWTLISDQASSEAFADAIDLAARPSLGTLTAIGNSITFSSSLFGSCSVGNQACEGGRKVIDISGDGINNNGTSPSVARDAALLSIDTINGLPIVTSEFPSLLNYFETNVIGGTGAFAIAANNFDDFGSAIQQKLLAEIAGTPPSNVIPETSTIYLFSSGLVGWLALMRRRKFAGGQL